MHNNKMPKVENTNILMEHCCNSVYCIPYKQAIHIPDANYSENELFN